MKAEHISLVIALWCTVLCFVLGTNDNDLEIDICKCPEDSSIPRPFYELFPGFGYYKLNTEAKNWYEAKETCEKEGAHLVIINSIQEVQILQTLRRRLPRTNSHANYLDDLIFVGITDKEKEGDWKTIFNASLGDTGFSTWDNAQPDLGLRENCGCLYTETGKLHDAGCQQIYNFFCEKEI